MTKRIKKHGNTLKLLANCDKHTTNSVIRCAKPDLISCISDICYNTLQGRVNLSAKEKARLVPYKRTLRKLADKSTTLKTKKVLIQKGHGLLSMLIGPLLNTVVGPIFKAITGK